MSTGEPIANDSIETFRQGKDEALRKVFKNHYRPLCLFAQKIIGNQDESVSIVHDVFLKLFHRHKDFESALNIKAFLYISTRNRCLDWLRSNSLRIRNTDSLNEQTHNASETTENQPAWAPYEVELLNKIWQSVQTLPPQCRKIFTMYYYQHMTVTEIANALQLEPGTVSKQLRIGEAKIRALITLITFLVILLTSFIWFVIK